MEPLRLAEDRLRLLGKSAHLAKDGSGGDLGHPRQFTAGFGGSGGDFGLIARIPLLILPQERLMLGNPLDHAGQFQRIHRFAQIIVDAETQRGNRRFRIGITGEQHHIGLPAVASPLDAGRQVDARHPLHADIRQQHREILLLKPAQGFFTAAAFDHFMMLVL